MSKEINSNPLPTAEEDPGLEREFQELAQWLIDVYLWRLEEKEKEDGQMIGIAF